MHTYTHTYSHIHLHTRTNRLHVGAVYLATDDESVVEDIREAMSGEGGRVMVQVFDRSIFSASMFIEHR
jgi:hypothetical protein